MRLSVRALSSHEYEVAADIERQDQPVTTWVGTLSFHLAAADWEDLRWYWEQFVDSPFDPAAQIAGRVERRMHEIGEELFISLFGPGRDMFEAWQAVSGCLADLRIEIEALSPEAGRIPWELIRPPDSEPLALCCCEFHRIIRWNVPAADGRRAQGPRALIVIRRPYLGEDVGYHSVARRVLFQLMASPVPIGLSVLRPPTFKQLRWVLEQYFGDGEAWDLVHFDCHGEFLDDDAVAEFETVTSPPAGGPRGYVLLEKEIFEPGVTRIQAGPL
ncbi:MAG: hypothetical protein HY820_28885 [Acidobacteria bacterium]|nr:hypothetical protein [Acidobacteriota bacterium]